MHFGSAVFSYALSLSLSLLSIPCKRVIRRMQATILCHPPTARSKNKERRKNLFHMVASNPPIFPPLSIVKHSSMRKNPSPTTTLSASCVYSVDSKESRTRSSVNIFVVHTFCESSSHPLEDSSISRTSIRPSVQPSSHSKKKSYELTKRARGISASDYFFFYAFVHIEQNKMI